MSEEEIKQQIEQWKSQQKAMEADYNKLTGAISAFEFLLAKMQASETPTNESGENVVKSTETNSQL